MKLQVKSSFEMRLVVRDSPSLPVMVKMDYQANDPYAVSLTFDCGGAGKVTWTFARSLLMEGVVGPFGEGDVEVWPSESASGSFVCIALSSPNGRALFEAPRAELMDFMVRTYAMVCPGTEGEHIDLDAEVAQLLWSEPGH